MEQTELNTCRTPARLVFADHMNRLVTGNSAPSSPKRAKMLAGVNPALDRPVILVPGRYQRYCTVLLQSTRTYDTTYFKDGRVNEVPLATIGRAPWILRWEC